MQYKHADMAVSDIATMLTNFKNLRIQDIKQFCKTLVLTQIKLLCNHACTINRFTIMCSTPQWQARKLHLYLWHYSSYNQRSVYDNNIAS